MNRLLLLLTVAGACTPTHPAYVPRDPDLRTLPFYFYPARPSARKPTATVFFLGNDIGFWGPHQKLAERLSSHGYAVIGFDVRKFLDRYPDSALLRDSALAVDLPPLILRATHELNGDSVPLILAGHSLGADLALRLDAVARMPRVVGILALDPTRRDHPTVTVRDQLNLGEPTEPGSFDVPEQVRNIPPAVHVALLRGSGDKERRSDPLFRKAGGSRLNYIVIPFASHSLKSLIIAGPMIENALEKLLAER